MSVSSNSTMWFEIEGRLTESDPSKIEFGQRVELTMIPFATDDAGDDIYTFAFRSVSA